MHALPNILVLHPDQIIAEVTAGLLQVVYGLNVLPLTDAVDAIEHVENLDFDVAIVSIEMPSALPVGSPLQVLGGTAEKNFESVLCTGECIGYIQGAIDASQPLAENTTWYKVCVPDGCANRRSDSAVYYVR